MKSYANELSAVLDRFDLCEKGLVRAKFCARLSSQPLTTRGTVDLVHLHLCLRIISTVVLQSSNDREILANDSYDFAKDVVSGIIAYHAIAFDDDHEHRALGEWSYGTVPDTLRGKVSGRVTQATGQHVEHVASLVEIDVRGPGFLDGPDADCSRAGEVGRSDGGAIRRRKGSVVGWARPARSHRGFCFRAGLAVS